MVCWRSFLPCRGHFSHGLDVDLGHVVIVLCVDGPTQSISLVASVDSPDLGFVRGGGNPAHGPVSGHGDCHGSQRYVVEPGHGLGIPWTLGFVGPLARENRPNQRRQRGIPCAALQHNQNRDVGVDGPWPDLCCRCSMVGGFRGVVVERGLAIFGLVCGHDSGRRGKIGRAL